MINRQFVNIAYILIVILVGLQTTNWAIRIHHGVPAKITEYPFLCKIYHFNRETGHAGRCTGSIIAAKWILTASHCFVSEKIGHVYACMGGEIATDQFCYRSVKISRSWEINEVDVALLKMKKQAPLGPTIQYAPLIETRDEVEDFRGTCVTIGWGLQEGGTFPDSLRMGFVNLTNVVPWYFSTRLIGVSEKQGPCPGDSGGPLICQDKVVGTVLGSTTKLCETPQLEVFYSNLHEHLEKLNWIMVKDIYIGNTSDTLDTSLIFILVAYKALSKKFF